MPGERKHGTHPESGKHGEACLEKNDRAHVVWLTGHVSSVQQKGPGPGDEALLAEFSAMLKHEWSNHFTVHVGETKVAALEPVN